jgi:hypothetical protein
LRSGHAFLFFLSPALEFCEQGLGASLLLELAAAARSIEPGSFMELSVSRTVILDMLISEASVGTNVSSTWEKIDDLLESFSSIFLRY